MASYGAHQQWQQPPSQRQYQYDQHPDPQAYQGPPPSQRRPPPQRHDHYNSHGSQQNGPRNGNHDVRNGDDLQQHSQQDYYRDQQYQEQYQHSDQYQDPYVQNRGHGRTYQHDERYHTKEQGRQHPVNTHYPQENERPPSKPRPPPLQEHRQKRKIPMPLNSAPLARPYPHPRPPYSPRHMRNRSNTHPAPRERERILAQRISPKSLAWDNPFGAFPPKKKENHHGKHASLDKGMGGLDPPHGAHPDQRPHTSQGQHKADTSRPNTSHGHRPEPRALDSPRLPQDDMPLRKPAPPPQGPPRDYGPSRPPVKGLPARPAPQRSVMPPPAPQASVYQHSGPVDPYGYEQQDVPMETQPRSPPQQQRTPVMRQDTDDSYGRRRPQENYDQSSYRGVPLHKPMSNQSSEAANLRASPPRSRQNQSDVPNFGAIPNDVDDTHMTPSPQPQAQDEPAYAKKSYQAYAALPPVDTHHVKPAAPEPSTASPLANFSFDLPSGNSRGSAPKQPLAQTHAPFPPSMSFPMTYDNPPKPQAAPRYNHPPMSPPATDQYDQQRHYDDQIHSNGQRALPRQKPPPPPSQFPPRGASRPDPQPRSASDAYANPPPSQARYRAGAEHMPPRPATSQAAPIGPNGHDTPPIRNGHDQAYNQRQAYGQGHDRNLPSQRGQYFDEGDPYISGQYGQQYDPRAPIPEPLPEDNFEPSPPRPQAPGSRHPPSQRNYVERTSLDYGRPSMPPGANSGNSGFSDRPVPYRPGLAAANIRTPSPVNAPSPAPMSKSQPQPNHQPQQALLVQRSASAPSPDGANDPPITVAELNNLRENFKNKPNDWGLGLRFAKRLIEAASVLSSENGKADPKTTAKNRERYILDAHKLLKKLIASGSPQAMFYLADCHGQGQLGLAPDPKEAFALYQSAAKINHPQSAYRVAVCCELGQDEGGGTRRDPMKAVQWYRRAATLGDTPAMYKLGMILLKGLLGQPKNPKEAVSWLKRAAERADKDNPHALHELGLLYESALPTDHIVRDERYAYSLFQQAAELGYKYSQFRLGSAWEYGLLGCQIDSRQSIAWYTRAAAQGEHQSELALSGWYLTGSEPLLQQSDQEAYLWARKAAMSGLAKAEYAMGYFTEVGIGTGADMEGAKRWYYRAAAQSFPKARERLEEMKRGGPKKSRIRVSRTGRSEGDCVVM